MSESTGITVVHLASGDLWAGAEMQLYTLARNLDSAPDLDLSVALLNHGELERQLIAAGIKVRVFDESVLDTRRLLSALISFFREIRPNIIHTHRIKENILGSVAGLFCGNPRQVRTTHGAQENKVPWWRLPTSLVQFLDWAAGRFLQDRIIAVSEELSEVLGKEFPPAKIATIVNGVDVPALRATDTSENPLPASTPGAVHIGIAGRLVPVKRVDLFIAIAKQVTGSRPDLEVRFHVLGDGPLREELEELSKTMSASGSVYFQGHRSDIYNWIRHIDIILMCSDHEGLPMILLESMALETPIIAHAVGGISALLDQGKCGVLVDDHTPEGYAKEIIRLADDPARRESIAKAAFRRVNEAYSAKRNADNVIELYTGLLKRPATRYP